MRVRLMFVFAIVATLLIPAGAASAETAHLAAIDLSDGCQASNEPNFDGLSVSGGLSGLVFAAGETLTIVADEPSDYGSPTFIALYVNQVGVDAEPYPGTLSFTFPQEGDVAAIGWIADGGNATWSVRCDAPERDTGEYVGAHKPAHMCGAAPIQACRALRRIGMR